MGIAVCRISGGLPDEGCYDVEVISDAGEVSHRSMVITDYFRQSKGPTGVCPLHPGHNMLATIGGWFGKDAPKPVAASEQGVPTQSEPGVAAEPPAGPDTRRTAEAAGAEPTKKKRGFWSRVFGKSKDNSPPPRDPPPPQ